MEKGTLDPRSAIALYRRTVVGIAVVMVALAMFFVLMRKRLAKPT